MGSRSSVIPPCLNPKPPPESSGRHQNLAIAHIERLQLLGGEGEKLAAAVFVSFDDLALLDLLAGSRIMRPERDPGRGGALLPISTRIVGAEPRYRWRRTTQIRQVVFVYINRRWLPHLVQANGFRACRRRRQIDRAGH